MSYFHGILNDNGWEKRIKIFLDLNRIHPYITSLFIENTLLKARIEKDICELDGTEYEYQVKDDDDDEVLVIGKERNNCWLFCFPCFFYPRFFLLTDHNKNNSKSFIV